MTIPEINSASNEATALRLDVIEKFLEESGLQLKFLIAAAFTLYSLEHGIQKTHQTLSNMAYALQLAIATGITDNVIDDRKEGTK